ncbi:MAG: BrnT family toxin [Verrucomicrobiia bacterium]
MNELSFEWDPKKAELNKAKHRVSFEEAKTVFYDERALVIPDPDHSNVEERFVIMGMSALSRVLVVVHCFRSSSSVIRIISARRAGTKEMKPYVKE